MSKDYTEDLVRRILEAKIDVEKLRKKPRIILINPTAFKFLEKEWLEDIKGLPWGDTLQYELEQKKKNNHNIFLADGTLFGLWVIKVDTVEEFEVR